MLTVEKLMEAGSDQVVFYKHWCEDEKEAVAFVKLIGEPRLGNHKGAYWAIANSGRIQATAFYKGVADIEVRDL